MYNRFGPNKLQVGDWVKWEHIELGIVVGKISAFDYMGMMFTMKDEGDMKFHIDHATKMTEEEAMLWKLKN